MERAKSSSSPHRAGKRANAGKRRRKRPMELRVFNSMREADEAARRYWWSRTPDERMRELERLRQLNYGYGRGKQLPKFEAIIRVVDMRTGKPVRQPAG